MRQLGFIFIVAALLSLGVLSAKGWQVSHNDLSQQLNQIENQHAKMEVDLSVSSEHIKNIDKQLAALDAQKLNERIIRLEEASEANLWFLRAILIPLLFLCLERLLSHTGVIPKKG
jgi:uncharacterized protein involved in exopolysaccharide biosynthesis